MMGAGGRRAARAGRAGRRDLLLPKLISGELDVSALDIKAQS
jgi:hypothetical protein